MIIKASGRSALLLAAGLFVCFAGPSLAAADAEDAAAATKSEPAGTPIELHKYARHGSRHVKKYAHRRPGKVAQKASTGDKTADAANDGGRSPPFPPSVANANAQLASTDAPPGSAAKAMTARANNILQATPDKPADAEPAADAPSDAKVVAADQLNEVDRELRQGSPAASNSAAAPPAAASAETSTAPAPVAANGSDRTAWDQSSLIGKIFIGFGALLTMASAARMFMA